MKILAEDLHRLCYNAVQFSAKDSSLKGVVWFLFRLDQVAVFASDDYVAMVDLAEASGDTGENFHLGLKEVKELEKWLRDKEGAVTLSSQGEEPESLYFYPEKPQEESEVLRLQIVSEPPDFSGVVEVVHSEPNPLTGEFSPSAEPFAIRAERFTKFRLLRTPESPSCKDGYPVDFLWDGRLVRWKCGPFLKGVVGPLTRVSYTTEDGIEITGIKDLYREEPGVLWE